MKDSSSGLVGVNPAPARLDSWSKLKKCVLGSEFWNVRQRKLTCAYIPNYL